MQHQLTIIGINGSPRKANTDLLLTEALSAAQRAGNIKTEKIDLREEKIGYCIGCLKCNNANDYPSGCQVHRDAMDTLTGKLMACHGLILASPVYFGALVLQGVVLSIFFGQGSAILIISSAFTTETRLITI